MSSSFTRRNFIKMSLLAGTGLAVSGFKIKNSFDIIIKNGKIVDGTGSKSFIGDIGIRNNKIIEIGNLSNASADNIIDATSYIVSPGFIDIHGHTDDNVLIDSRCESKLFQGITTETCGNCGDSVFPFLGQDLIEFKKGRNAEYGLDVKWNNLHGFYEQVRKNPGTINICSYVGQGTLRAAVVGKNDIAPTKEQLKLMQKMLEEDMEAGALGLSSGLEYAPGSYAKIDELVALCKIVAKYNGVYAIHLRDEANKIEEAIAEAVEIARQSGVSLQISHLKTCYKNNWNKLDKIFKLLDDAKKSGININADRYPYTAFATYLAAFLPISARQGSDKDILTRLNDKNNEKSFTDYMQSRIDRMNGPEGVLISNCTLEKNKIWQGKSLKECIEKSGKSAFEFIKFLLNEDELKSSMIGFAMNEENLKKIYQHPLVMVGSDGYAISPNGKLSTGNPHPRYYGAFPRVISKYVREEQTLSLETAIHKMAGMPAHKLNIANRGIIAKGNYADIAIFDFSTIKDKSTYVNPHQLSEGIEYVIVNGKIAINRAKITSERAGLVV